MNVTPGLSRRLIHMIMKDFIFRHDGVFYKPVKVEMEEGLTPNCEDCCEFEPYCDAGFEHFCMCALDETTVFKKMELPETSGYDRLVDLCRQLQEVTQDLKTITLANGKVK
jgi:hypothetical protein